MLVLPFNLSYFTTFWLCRWESALQVTSAGNFEKTHLLGGLQNVTKHRALLDLCVTRKRRSRTNSKNGLFESLKRTPSWLSFVILIICNIVSFQGWQNAFLLILLDTVSSRNCLYEAHDYNFFDLNDLSLFIAYMFRRIKTIVMIHSTWHRFIHDLPRNWRNSWGPQPC